MPTEHDRIIANLTSAYDFANKIVIHAGAGGGKLLGYAASCRKVVAVDNDVSALERLEQRVGELALQKIVTVVACDFYDLERWRRRLVRVLPPRDAIRRPRSISGARWRKTSSSSTICPNPGGRGMRTKTRPWRGPGRRSRRGTRAMHSYETVQFDATGAQAKFAPLRRESATHRRAPTGPPSSSDAVRHRAASRGIMMLRLLTGLVVAASISIADRVEAGGRRPRRPSCRSRRLRCHSARRGATQPVAYVPSNLRCDAPGGQAVAAHPRSILRAPRLNR
jgi:hypothetical protein